MTLDLQPVELSALFDELRATVATLARSADVTLTIDDPDGPLVIRRADRVKLSQVLVNLAGNAVKFTPAGGRIRISARAEPRGDEPGALLVVEDTGIGIPAHALSFVFERFRQVDGGHTRRHGGAGLGLAITKSLVELHAGRVWAESVEGEGSRFFVWLPLSGPTGPVAAEPLPADAGRLLRLEGARRRVLVIDDDFVQLQIMGKYLRQAGLEVDLEPDPVKGMRMIFERTPDAVILDVMMPQMSGLTILRAIRDDPRTRALPVFVSTAFHGNIEIVESLGAVWLPKPWNERSLLTPVLDRLQPEEPG